MIESTRKTIHDSCIIFTSSFLFIAICKGNLFNNELFPPLFGVLFTAILLIWAFKKEPEYQNCYGCGKKMIADTNLCSKCFEKCQKGQKLPKE